MTRTEWIGANRNETQRRQIDSLVRLFDAILADRELPRSMVALLAGLRGPAIRLALADESLASTPDHPLWRFVDRLAFVDTVLGADEPGRAAFYRCARTIIRRVIEEETHDATQYEWALDALMSFERQLLARHAADALPHIEMLQASSVDTSRPVVSFPGELGRWIRLWIDGQWREAQLIWHDPSRRLALYRGWQDGRIWKLRASVLERLFHDGLARSWQPRSLVKRVMLRIHPCVHRFAPGDTDSPISSEATWGSTSHPRKPMFLVDAS